MSDKWACYIDQPITWQLTELIDHVMQTDKILSMNHEKYLIASECIEAISDQNSPQAKQFVSSVMYNAIILILNDCINKATMTYNILESRLFYLFTKHRQIIDTTSEYQQAITLIRSYQEFFRCCNVYFNDVFFLHQITQSVNDQTTAITRSINDSIFSLQTHINHWKPIMEQSMEQKEALTSSLLNKLYFYKQEHQRRETENPQKIANKDDFTYFI